MIEIKDEDQIAAEKIFSSMTEEEKIRVGRLVALQFPVEMLEAITYEMRCNQGKLQEILNVMSR